MIETRDLTRLYGDYKAVEDVSCRIESGEIVGLLGHNGAGKTTIMKMMTGYLEPTSGSILVDDLNITNDRLAIQQRIGYLPENCPLYPDMTVIDFLDYAAGLRGLTVEARKPAIRMAIRRMELEDKATHLISTLSRGYRQRVGVAQAILKQSDILILDEPTNGLDPSQIQHMLDLIVELGRESTVILSTHILREVETVCDRVLIIRNGRLAVDSRIKDLEKGQKLILVIDAAPGIAVENLLRIAGVSSAEFLRSSEDRYHYALEFAVLDGSVDEMSHPVARTVLDLGYRLFGLTPEKRDLEGVFNEVNATDRDTGGHQDAA